MCRADDRKDLSVSRAATSTVRRTHGGAIASIHSSAHHGSAARCNGAAKGLIARACLAEIARATRSSWTAWTTRAADRDLLDQAHSTSSPMRLASHRGCPIKPGIPATPCSVARPVPSAAPLVGPVALDTLNRERGLPDAAARHGDLGISVDRRGPTRQVKQAGDPAGPAGRGGRWTAASSGDDLRGVRARPGFDLVITEGCREEISGRSARRTRVRLNDRLTC